MIYATIRDLYRAKNGDLMEIVFKVAIFNGINDLPSFTYSCVISSTKYENASYDYRGFVTYNPSLEFNMDF